MAVTSRRLFGLVVTAILLASCSRGTEERTAYRDLRAGASQGEAFDYVCGHWNENENLNLFLQTGPRERSLPTSSICDVEGEAMGATQWMFVDGKRTHEYVVLHFQNGVLVRITTMRRGFDT